MSCRYNYMSYVFLRINNACTLLVRYALNSATVGHLSEVRTQLKQIKSKMHDNCDAVHFETDRRRDSRSGLRLSKCILHMRTNCYFPAFCQNFNITIRFSDFFKRQQFGDQATFSGVFFSLYILTICQISISGLFDLEHVSHVELRTGIIYIKFELSHPFPTFNLLLIRYVTLPP